MHCSCQPLSWSSSLLHNNAITDFARIGSIRRSITHWCLIDIDCSRQYDATGIGFHCNRQSDDCWLSTDQLYHFRYESCVSAHNALFIHISNTAITHDACVSHLHSIAIRPSEVSTHVFWLHPSLARNVFFFHFCRTITRIQQSFDAQHNAPRLLHTQRIVSDSALLLCSVTFR